LPKITKLIKLSELGAGYSKAKSSVKQLIKDEVGASVQSSILGYLSNSTSPIKGESRFERLKPNYKKWKRKKVGSGSPNLELFGDMLGKLEYRPHRQGVEVGIWDETQSKKAELHNRWTGKAVSHANKMNVAERKFIPKKGERFKSKIESQIKEIIKENVLQSEIETQFERLVKKEE